MANQKVKLRNVRISFPELFEAKQVQGQGEPGYSAALLFDKKHPAVADINAAAELVGSEKWGAKWATVKKELVLKDKMPIHDGAHKSYTGYEGNLYVQARRKAEAGAPVVYDSNGVVLTTDTGQIYSGCYVHATIEVYTNEHPVGGKRVTVGLVSVRFAQDGESFGGASRGSASDYDDVAVDEEDTELV